MKINAIFDNIKIYDVQERLDVVKGEKFVIEILEELPSAFDIFTNKDPVLDLGEDNRTVMAAKLGESTIRFMSGSDVIKDLVIDVVDKVALQAKNLNATFSDPVQK